MVEEIALAALRTSRLIRESMEEVGEELGVEVEEVFNGIFVCDLWTSDSGLGEFDLLRLA